MKTRRFDFDFKPLQITKSLSVEGSVPSRQTYNPNTGTYTPDYTLTNLVLQPRIGQMDKDAILQPGSVNSSITNVNWYEIIDGVKTQIQDSNSSYYVSRSGYDAGQIVVKKNAVPEHPITLQFSCQYIDTRTNQIYTIQDSFLVISSSDENIPELYLDAVDQSIYDPLVDTSSTQIIHASLRIGTKDVVASNREFVWELKRDDNTFSQIGTETTLDYFAQVSSDGTSCTLHKNLMGESVTIRCRAKYDADGSPSSVALDDASPSKVVEFVRRVHDYQYDIYGCPTNIPSGYSTISPTARIYDTNGDIQDAEKELIVLWYAATNAESGTLIYTKIAHGKDPGTLSTEKMNDTYGAVYGIEVNDIGPWCAWEDSDGSVIEDGDGNLIIIH